MYLSHAHQHWGIMEASERSKLRKITVVHHKPKYIYCLLTYMDMCPLFCFGHLGMGRTVCGELLSWKCDQHASSNPLSIYLFYLPLPTVLPDWTRRKKVIQNKSAALTGCFLFLYLQPEFLSGFFFLRMNVGLNAGSTQCVCGHVCVCLCDLLSPLFLILAHTDCRLKLDLTEVLLILPFFRFHCLKSVPPSPPPISVFLSYSFLSFLSYYSDRPQKHDVMKKWSHIKIMRGIAQW